MNKILHLYERLYKEFGPQKWWPVNSKYSGGPKNKQERFEVCIGAILTQNTAWKNVEKALGNLRNAKALSRKKLAEMQIPEIAKLIKPAGYYNQKAKKIREFLKFNGKLTRENLLSIWGIGPETADSILLYAYSKPIFVIDAYTKRICARIGLCSENADYIQLQNLFYNGLPSDTGLFNEYHALLVELAKKNCRKEPVCDNCPVGNLCKSFK